jgi:uncharacterized membrane protein YqjE
MQTASQRGLERDLAQQPAPDPGLSLSAALRSVYYETSALLHDHLRLAALEAQQAVRNLVMMIAIGIAAALLAITAWLALVATMVAWAVDHGASWPGALLGAAIVSAAAALGAGLLIRHLASRLMFALTLRWLRPTEQRPDVPRVPPQEARI